jgi:hypothetical protein
MATQTKYSSVTMRYSDSVLTRHRPSNMLNDTKSSPIEKAVGKFYSCMSQIYYKIKPCLSELTTSCKTAKLRAAKEVWTDMRLVLALLRRGTGFKVVHLIRDPRGMLVSRERYDKGIIFNKHYVSDTCTRLSRDLVTYKQLAAEFPRDSIQIRYEDLVQWPEKVATQVYTMVGLDDQHATAVSDSVDEQKVHRLTRSIFQYDSQEHER